MPRIARIIAVGYPHHVTQRGNNRATVFFDDEDRQTYLKLLTKLSQQYHLQIWAYCLMDNHIHLLAMPETEIALSRGIGLTNMMYTQYLNRKLNQSGRIWQNRFFSCVVENDSHLWAVARYIEQNPVKAELVSSAEAYGWSSGKAHILGIANPILPKKSWLSPRKRKAYAELVRNRDGETDNAIRQATRTGRPFGSGRFVDKLETRLQLKISVNKPGRPRKKE